MNREPLQHTQMARDFSMCLCVRVHNNDDFRSFQLYYGIVEIECIHNYTKQRTGFYDQQRHILP